MAEPKQLKILRQGVGAWNNWREENPKSEIELSEANLGEASLSEANLEGANLRSANLREANLREANLGGANLMGADLRNADLQRSILWGANLWRADPGTANLKGANFWGADLGSANLMGANLRNANLKGVILWGANLLGASLFGADLRGASLSGANLGSADLRKSDLREADLGRANLNEASLAVSILAGAYCGGTIFGSSDLSEVIDLDVVIHRGPSTLGTNTLRLSKEKIPEVFLRGCGLSDWEIESAKLYTPDLRKDEFIYIQHEVFRLLAQQPRQIASLFISYSHSDLAFVEKMQKHLDEKGVRYWCDDHDATAGRLEKIINSAIRNNPIVLLVLSSNALQSDWVEHEVSDARRLEKEIGRDVLCPVAIDDEWKKQNSWSRVLFDQVRKYNILDFSKWKDDFEFSMRFRLLLEGLELFYERWFQTFSATRLLNTSSGF
ncbi:MAG: toll/interleukin-1 receptor domain-containing protein, partial [Anaerolineales bacterium]